jgi:glycosyltransferase involved in cell wall biosynthesis
VSIPLITIGLTCFNAEETIARAIGSALSQDWPNIEVVVVDDSSSDGSAAVIEAAVAGEKRARLIRHRLNTGPAVARNTILQKAKGEFVVFFDDDDESLPGRVSSQLKTLSEHEARSGATLVACYAGGARLYPNGYLKPLQAIGAEGTEVPNGPDVADYLLFYRRRAGWFYGAGVPACALMARRSTFEAVGGFDVGLRRLEDVDFAIRLAFEGGHFVGTTDRLLLQYATEAADKSPEKNLEAEQLLAKKNRDYLHSRRRFYYALHWPKLRYWHFRRRYGRFFLELLGLLIRYPHAAAMHFLKTVPRRLRHEAGMHRRADA